MCVWRIIEDEVAMLAVVIAACMLVFSGAARAQRWACAAQNECQSSVRCSVPYVNYQQSTCEAVPGKACQWLVDDGHPNGFCAATWMFCDDSKGKSSDRLDSCRCPKSGKWRGFLTNGTWMWDTDYSDWRPDVGDADGKGVYVAGFGVVAASVEWEFWVPDDGSLDESMESFMVQTLTVWGQPVGGAFETGIGKVARAEKFTTDGGNTYTGARVIQIRYRCQVLYTDTQMPWPGTESLERRGHSAQVVHVPHGHKRRPSG